MRTQVMKNDFTARTQALGIARTKCGLSHVECLQELKCGSLTREAAVRVKRTYQLGPLIAAGLARWNDEAGGYTITPAGESWLTELEIHGLISGLGGCVS